MAANGGGRNTEYVFPVPLWCATRRREQQSRWTAGAEAQGELLRVSRRLILEKLWSIRETLNQLGSAKGGEVVPSLVESLEFDSQSLIRTLDEVEGISELSR